MFFFIGALAVLFLISAYRILLRSPFSPPVRAAFISIRFLLLALIATAFIEPVLTFERLATFRRPVPVLVDVSKSMQLFSHDTSLSRSREALEKWNAGHAGEKQNFHFYGFGDSLRQFRSHMPLLFSDRRSLFPDLLKEKALQKAAAVLVISDGNFSNATLPAEHYLKKNVAFVPFRGPPRHLPFLLAHLRDFPSVSPADSVLTAVIELEGFAGKRGTITVLAARDDRTIAQKKIRVPEGIYRKKLAMRFRAPSAGRHCYRFVARSPADSLFCSCYALNTAVPGLFTYKLCGSRPSLDRRFIRLALRQHPHFIEAAHRGIRSPDLLVIFEWNDSARTAMSRLKRGGTALCIGCIPCDSAPSGVSSTGTVALIHSGAGLTGSPFDDYDLSALPPPARCLVCKSLSARVTENHVSAVLRRTGDHGFDTLNLVVAGRYNRRTFLAVAAKGLWQFDFRQLAIAPDEAGGFGFSRRLLECVKTILLNGLSEELLFYPASALSESDSLSFFAVFPNHLPIPSELRFSVSFFSANVPSYDTSFRLVFSGSPRRLIRFKTLPADYYRLAVSAALSPSEAEIRCSFPDSVLVDQDRSEFMAQGQNAALLSSFARPLDDFSETSLRSVLSGNDGTALPEKETVHFTRSWPLLLLILMTFSAELLMRRIVRAE